MVEFLIATNDSQQERQINDVTRLNNTLSRGKVTTDMFCLVLAFTLMH